MINIDDYQDFVETTVLHGMNDLEAYSHNGLMAEVGEFYDVLAKYNRADFDTNILEERVMKELGDIQWFICRLATNYGFSMSEILDANVDKLTDRHERGVVRGAGDNR